MSRIYFDAHRKIYGDLQVHYPWTLRSQATQAGDTFALLPREQVDTGDAGDLS